MKLKRDVVVSMTNQGDVVGVYVKYPHFVQEDDGTIGKYFDEVMLAEMSPKEADNIIRIWERI